MRRLAPDMLSRISEAINGLAADPRPPGTKKLVGGLGWRIRVGDYRVIYQIEDEEKVVTIAVVKPRQSAYS